MLCQERIDLEHNFSLTSMSAVMCGRRLLLQALRGHRRDAATIWSTLPDIDLERIRDETLLDYLAIDQCGVAHDEQNVLARFNILGM